MHLRQKLFFVINVLLLTFAFSSHSLAQDKELDSKESTITIVTNMGSIELELTPKQAPETVKNFISYAQSGFFSGTIFHRVIPGFMIQGGGFDSKLRKKPTEPPIRIEASTTHPNKRGTIAMARTSDPNSATSQFFINVVDNDYLNKAPGNPGYTVFGRVTKGMDIVDKIAKVKTATQNRMRDVPVEPVIIESVTYKPEQ